MTVTVAQLIEKLSALDPDLTVVLDPGPGGQMFHVTDLYEGSPEIGYRYAILEGDDPIPAGPRPHP